jgi:cytochrome c2
MFEVFGRSEKRFDIAKLKKLHQISGYLFLLLSLVITYYCLDFIIKTKAEPTSRATLHSVFSLAVILLIIIKIIFVRFYRQFYGQVQMIGLVIAILSFGMVGTSGGYYLFSTKFGTDREIGEVIEQKHETVSKAGKITLRTDSVSIKNGKELYESKCSFCHDPYSTKTNVGPGHKDILKNHLLPVSKKPATPENIAEQLRNPHRDMPSFSYLDDKDVQNIIAYLNTL